MESTTGNEIIFSSRDRKNDKDDRSSGLKEINGSGLDDNTGLGINVEDKGGVVSVRQLRKMNSPDVTIQVPKGIVVYYEYESQYGGEVKMKNLENEIEISANYNSVELENITGPVTARVVYGHVEADFQSNLKGPISIVSVYGYVDVAMSPATKANIRMSTSYGELYASPEFKIDMDKGFADEETKVSGKLNGGGITIDLNSNYGKVYLRKK